MKNTGCKEYEYKGWFISSGDHKLWSCEPKGWGIESREKFYNEGIGCCIKTLKEAKKWVDENKDKYKEEDFLNKSSDDDVIVVKLSNVLTDSKNVMSGEHHYLTSKLMEDMISGKCSILKKDLIKNIEEMEKRVNDYNTFDNLYPDEINEINYHLKGLKDIVEKM